MKMMKAGWMAMGALAATLLVPGMAWADRSTSLQGNRLIEDADDVFAYPHLTTKYKDRITLDLGTSGTVGNGLFLMDGGNFTWGVALHRGNIFDSASVSRNDIDALNVLGIPGGAPGGFTLGAPAPLTVADVLLGFGDLGFRLSLGTGYNSTTIPNGQETGAGVQFGNLAVSFGGVENWDLGLHVGLLLGDQTAANNTTSEGSQIRAAATARGYIPSNQLVRLGVLGRLGFVTQSVDDITVGPPSVTNTRSGSSFDLLVGAGPSITLAERANIAAYATLGFQTSSFDPSASANNDNASAQSILLPGANVAMEIMITDWFSARAGMEYNHVLNSTGQLSAAGETTTSSNAKNFGWSAGMGLQHEGFRLDGTFSSGFLTQGPDFIGGDGALFTMVSASYSFGDASRMPLPSATEEAAPAAAQPAPANRPATTDVQGTPPVENNAAY